LDRQIAIKRDGHSWFIVVASAARAMSKANCLIVRAFSQQLDNFRSEASRIAKGSKMDRWTERTDKGYVFAEHTSIDYRRRVDPTTVMDAAASINRCVFSTAMIALFASHNRWRLPAFHSSKMVLAQRC